jgi:alginate O-acetyltransferase complex protein AlgI
MPAQLLAYAVGLLCTAIFVRLARKTASRQIILLTASYIFYGSLGVWFLAVLVSSSLINFFLGHRLRCSRAPYVLWAGILFNLGLLVFFKYLPQTGSALVRVVMPVGLSFWTFQALSYLFDLYREEELDPTPVEFCLYMAFAPTVVSGPICRLHEILPQLRHYTEIRRLETLSAIQRIWLGALMIALGQLLGSGIQPGLGIDYGYESARGLHALDAWLLAIGYGFQLFFDFAGYSHVAIGSAHLLGVRVPENFDAPYISTSPSIFWTRWHKSLSFWIRDYLFLPLATMRRGIWWRYSALLFSMIVFGLWHKGSLLFLIWGAYHGSLLVLHRLWQHLLHGLNWRWEGTLQTALSWLVTFSAICLGWIFFRAHDLSGAFRMFAALISPSGYFAPTLPKTLYILAVTLTLGYFVVTKVSARGNPEVPVLGWIPMELRYACYAVTIYLLVFRTMQPQPFIYSQF